MEYHTLDVKQQSINQSVVVEKKVGRICRTQLADDAI